MPNIFAKNWQKHPALPQENPTQKYGDWLFLEI